MANFVPLPDGRSISRSGRRSRRRRQQLRASRRATPSDCRAYYAMLERVADVLRELALETPPNVGGGVRDALAALAAGKRLRQLDMPARRDVLDLFTKSAGAVARCLVRVRCRSRPRSASTRSSAISRVRTRRAPAYVLLHHVFGEVNGKTRRCGATPSAAWARSRRRWRRRRGAAASKSPPAAKSRSVCVDDARRAGRAARRRPRNRGALCGVRTSIRSCSISS